MKKRGAKLLARVRYVLHVNISQLFGPQKAYVSSNASSDEKPSLPVSGKNIL